MVLFLHVSGGKNHLYLKEYELRFKIENVFKNVQSDIQKLGFHY